MGKLLRLRRSPCCGPCSCWLVATPAPTPAGQDAVRRRKSALAPVGDVTKPGRYCEVPFLLLGRRRGDLPRQRRRARNEKRHDLFGRARAEAQAHQGRRLPGSGQGLSRRQDAVPPRHHEPARPGRRAAGQGPAHPARRLPATDLVHGRPPGGSRGHQDAQRPQGQEDRPAALRPARRLPRRRAATAGPEMEERRHRRLDAGRHRPERPGRDVPQGQDCGRLLRRHARHARPDRRPDHRRHRRRQDRQGRPRRGLHAVQEPLHRRRLRLPQGLLRQEQGSGAEVRGRLPQGLRGPGGPQDQPHRQGPRQGQGREVQGVAQADPGHLRRKEGRHHARDLDDVHWRSSPTPPSSAYPATTTSSRTRTKNPDQLRLPRPP